MFNLPKRRAIFLTSLLIALSGKPYISAAVEVGEKAADFTLPSTNGVDISLSDFRGKKWVFLEFFAAAYVPT